MKELIYEFVANNAQAITVACMVAVLVKQIYDLDPEKDRKDFEKFMKKKESNY
jgi:hypothetical protein